MILSASDFSSVWFSYIFFFLSFKINFITYGASICWFAFIIRLTWVNRLYHRSPMQTEQSQPKGKRIIPETRFTDPRAGISRPASENDDWIFCLPIIGSFHKGFVQSVGYLTRKSGFLGSIPGLAPYFRFFCRFFKKGSCQLLAKVCARSTG